ncbi:hypothetical protein ACL7TT_11475 [Microbulbifer sp. 2304DJ12-6]|uniref:hypothetical protein n=1 Tax=Microbulbifer sp. 2304DJ12-6 TaxID=3233340 RepID=UPI0039B01207
MDKQSIHSEVAEFLKTEQGAALVAESLSALINSQDVVLIQPKERVVAKVQIAIKKIDEAQQALSQADQNDRQSVDYSRHQVELLKVRVKLSEIVQFLKPEQGEALGSESPIGARQREPEPEVSLTREQILNQATDLAARQGCDVEFWVGNIQSAINRLNGAQPVPMPDPKS